MQDDPEQTDDPVSAATILTGVCKPVVSLLAGLAANSDDSHCDTSDKAERPVLRLKAVRVYVCALACVHGVK